LRLECNEAEVVGDAHEIDFEANLGEAARQVIAGRMLLAGLDVFHPIGEDTPVDLLVLRCRSIQERIPSPGKYV
jgi:hypothetical protein